MIVEALAADLSALGELGDDNTADVARRLAGGPDGAEMADGTLIEHRRSGDRDAVIVEVPRRGAMTGFLRRLGGIDGEVQVTVWVPTLSTIAITTAAGSTRAPGRFRDVALLPDL